ncbi:hypothetical protein LLE49_20005 [Alicyclobacillus tolerans]|uniref:hypothetical protein n=1 Tax=Alicyclobacillus tolerans TaxID=90970 RepID=UPI001F1D7E59|nr:hypothetical protein [Alicyclobacillus tolerans]MCF8567008.1 hypothetical protein [Alicyclobacillus tolerans]
MAKKGIEFIREKNREAHRRYYPERYYRLDDEGTVIVDDDKNPVEDPAKVAAMNALDDRQISQDVISAAKRVPPRSAKKAATTLPDPSTYLQDTAKNVASFGPKGSIATMLFIVLFVLFALIPVDVNGATMTRLQLMWMAINGHATITPTKPDKLNPTYGTAPGVVVTPGSNVYDPTTGFFYPTSYS